MFNVAIKFVENIKKQTVNYSSIDGHMEEAKKEATVIVHMNESEGTDYAADNSFDHSSSAAYSRRHKPTQYGDSALARKHLLNNDNRDLKRQCKKN